MIWILIISIVLNVYLLKRKTVKTDMALVGWVNVYDQEGMLRISCRPKRNKKQAFFNRPTNPKSTYVETIAIYKNNS
jgi:hypothetical protein